VSRCDCFHGRKTVAPLKHPKIEAMIEDFRRFPRSKDRGSIEAALGPVAPYQNALVSTVERPWLH